MRKLQANWVIPIFGWFSQGKSNDWKEIWLELYLEGINCQSNVPNPRPELIYLPPEWKTRTKIHKVHPKWGLSRGRLMIPIRVYGSSDPSLNPSIGCQSVSQSTDTFPPPSATTFLYRNTETIQSNYRASSCWQFAQGDPSFYLLGPGIGTKILFLPLERKLQK